MEKKVDQNKKDIEILYNEIKLLKDIKKNKPELNTNNIDSKIVKINEINFILKYLEQMSLFQNQKINFDLLYRGTRDGDNSINLHNVCDNHKNVIILMKSEQGKRYGGFSSIGWKSRERGNWEYPIDDSAFLFSIDNQKIFEAIKGKNKICWINSDEFGLSFYSSLTFYNNFLTEKKANVLNDVSNNFKNCNKKYFNSGIESCKFSELEVFHIS